MVTNDAERKVIIGQDTRWLAGHQVELWAAAQSEYAKSGRGAVIVIFNVPKIGSFVICYAGVSLWRASGIEEQIAYYNPATQMVIVCLGQLDDAGARIGPRSYRVQYLTSAA